MNRFKLVSLALLLSVASFGQKTWQSDKAHSKLTFSITHLGISDVLGMFTDFDVTINASSDDFSDAVFELSTRTASINTAVDRRDTHLKSADFFDVEKFPAMTFKSSAIKKISQDKYQLTGDLTLHGVTHPVTMDLWYRGTLSGPTVQNPTAGFQLTGTLKRSDFGIGPKFTEPMLSDEVKIRADGEFKLAK
mgnify:CR=1 FL=1